MPPPPPPADTTSYMQMLHRDMAQRAAEYDEHRRLKREIELKRLQMELAGLSAPTKPNKPQRQPIDIYETQIRQWHSSLPPEARQAPRTMSEFIAFLSGRTPGANAHAGDVSKILKERLGWSRRRCWKADGEGRRLWYPPNTTNTHMSYSEK